jgi:small subunit ribosomal protein S16
MVAVKSDRVQLKMERIDYWLSVGAQPSEKVAVLIKKVRTNDFTEGAAPSPLTPQKAPPPPPEEPAAEAAPEASADGGDAAAEATDESSGE